MQLFHKEECENNDKDEELINELEYISEDCFICYEEMTYINEIWADEDDRYCHEDCGKYHGLNIRKCKEIY